MPGGWSSSNAIMNNNDVAEDEIQVQDSSVAEDELQNRRVTGDESIDLWRMRSESRSVEDEIQLQDDRVAEYEVCGVNQDSRVADYEIQAKDRLISQNQDNSVPEAEIETPYSSPKSLCLWGCIRPFLCQHVISNNKRLPQLRIHHVIRKKNNKKSRQDDIIKKIKHKTFEMAEVEMPLFDDQLEELTKHLSQLMEIFEVSVFIREPKGPG